MRPIKHHQPHLWAVSTAPCPDYLYCTRIPTGLQAWQWMLSLGRTKTTESPRGPTCCTGQARLSIVAPCLSGPTELLCIGRDPLQRGETILSVCSAPIALFLPPCVFLALTQNTGQPVSFQTPLSFFFFFFSVPLLLLLIFSSPPLCLKKGIRACGWCVGKRSQSGSISTRPNVH